MTADKPNEPVPEGEEQAKPATGAKPAVAKKPAAKNPPAKKAAEAESAGAKAVAEGKPARAPKASAKKDEPPAKKPPAKAGNEDEPTEKKTPATKKPVAKKQADKEPAAEKASTTKAKKPDATEPEKPASTARRDAQSSASTSRRKVVRAQARYVRTSARKARMVCGHLRGKSVGEARAILAFTPREVARDWSKLLESAVANAENNHELIEDDLLVREAYADEGPTIKRFRPRAQGRATPIRKRTSHLTITLTPKP